MKQDLFLRLAMLASALALVVVVLGAFVRLSHAGLGCPDWPGCYGHIDIPLSHTEVRSANEAYPDRPVEAHKAWKEMIHRYFAGTLGLLVFTLAFIAFRKRKDPQQQFIVPIFIALLIIFQALLGMWTVTIKLNPTIVMSHLLGGLATLSLLWWVSLRQGKLFAKNRLSIPAVKLKRLKNLALVGLLLVILQIMLGGWTSANYAALHCPDFPTCQGQWLPPTDFKEAFTMWRGTEQNFEGGVLDNDARVTIHLMHRIVAVIVLLYIGALSLLMILRPGLSELNGIGKVILFILILQIGLGISNVIFSLPLFVAVAHNGVAAILLLTLVTLNHILRPGVSNEYA